MLSVEVSINGSPAWLVTATQADDAPASTEVDAPRDYRVAVYDAAGLESIRMAGEDPKPITVTTVEHVRADGALRLAAAAAQSVADVAGSSTIDEKLIDRLR